MKANFAKFCETVAKLRHPKTGCPWDLEQTHATLRKYMIEEAYEAAQVMNQKNDQELCEELGDVLLQVVLNAQIAKDRKAFTINDVIRSIDEKMVRRHPHVFDRKSFAKKQSISDVWSNWEKLKSQEVSVQGKTLLESKIKKASKQAPASRMAAEIGKVTAEIDFDWQSAREVFSHLETEIAELKAEVCKRKRRVELVSAEIGDVFFTLVQLCRHLKLDSETVFLESNQKFLRRFKGMLILAKEKQLSFEKIPLSEKEKLWKKIKKKFKH